MKEEELKLPLVLLRQLLEVVVVVSVHREVPLRLQIRQLLQRLLPTPVC